MNTQKNFAMQVGALITLYVSITSFLILVFGLINVLFPDVADTYWEIEGNQEGMRYAIAALLVFFPTYILLTRLVNQARRKADNLYHTLTKWVVYLSLVVGGLIMLGDLVAVILTYLNGEITVRFILKALAMFLTVGAAFWYYALDAKGHWNENERASIRAGAFAFVFVIAALVLGFYHIDSPQTVREMRLDDQQVSDLQDIQWRIEAYYEREESLPQTVDQLYDDIEIPTAPEDRDSYTYRITGEQSYELCATFAFATTETDRASIARPFVEEKFDPNNYNWEHGAGEKCFTRTVSISSN